MNNWGPAIRIIGIGFYISACIVGGILGGLWLDRKFSTEPILLLVGLVLGLVLAFWGVYQMIIPMVNNDKKGRN